MGEECSFSLIAFFDADVVVSPADVHNCELGAPTEMVYNLRDEKGYISILFCPFIQWSVVLYWS